MCSRVRVVCECICVWMSGVCTCTLVCSVRAYLSNAIIQVYVYTSCVLCVCVYVCVSVCVLVCFCVRVSVPACILPLSSHVSIRHVLILHTLLTRIQWIGLLTRLEAMQPFAIPVHVHCVVLYVCFRVCLNVCFCVRLCESLRVCMCVCIASVLVCVWRGGVPVHLYVISALYRHMSLIIL